MSEQEVSLGTLYELNKAAVATEKPLKSYEIKDKLKEIQKFLVLSSNYYFMLLCREEYDFTLFNLLDKEDSTLAQATKDLKECLQNRGEIISIDLTENKDAYEIWIRKDNNGIYAYYLFPYDIGVIEVGKE
jgi:hypothetical protein